VDRVATSAYSLLSAQLEVSMNVDTPIWAADDADDLVPGPLDEEDDETDEDEDADEDDDFDDEDEGEDEDEDGDEPAADEDA
jgi:hypothetical protein